MAAKIKSNFEAVRELMFATQGETRTAAEAKRIAAACKFLNLNEADTFRIFASLEYANKDTGEPYNFARGRRHDRKIIPGLMLWNFRAYQADMAAKAR